MINIFILSNFSFFFAIPDDKDEPKSEKVLASLETIDDDCDRSGIILVKLDNPKEAQQYGIDEIPSLVYFEDTIPHLFEGNLGKKTCLKTIGLVLHYALKTASTRSCIYYPELILFFSFLI